MAQSQHLVDLAFTFCIALFLALCCTPVAMQLARWLNVMDKPNPRKVHTETKPYLGGVAIYVAFLVGTLLFTPLTREVIAILIGATVMMLVGALDDKYDLSSKLRLAIQVGCALLAVWSGICVEGIGNPVTNEFIPLGILSWPLTILWIVAITNVINFIDGLDGLAAGTTAIICVSLMLVAWREEAYSVMLMVAALAGGSLGFLRYNFNPAKIFMGDAGAVFIGFVLGCLTVQGPMKHAAFWTMVTPVLALGLPLFDTAVVMLRRIRRGQSPMQADRTHAHHRLFDSGLSQKQTVLWLYAISTCFGLAAIGITSIEGRLVSFAVGIIGLGLFSHAHRLESKQLSQRQTKDLTNALRGALQNTRNYSSELQGLSNSEEGEGDKGKEDGRKKEEKKKEENDHA